MSPGRRLKRCLPGGASAARKRARASTAARIHHLRSPMYGWEVAPLVVGVALGEILLSASLLFAASDAVQCKVIEGATSVVKKGTILLIGEQHGTNEIPAGAGELACLASTEGLSTLVLLELPATWNPAFERFLNERDPESALRVFKTSVGWATFHQPYQPDGRSSVAIAKLLKDLHGLRMGGAKLTIRAFDSRPFEPPQANNDFGMASSLVRNIEESPADFTLLLTGNLHSRLRRDTTKIKPEPMAYLASLARPKWNFVSINATFSSGEAWACTISDGSTEMECQSSVYKTRWPPSTRKIVVSGVPDENGYHGTFYVGPITAALPDR